MLVLKKAMRIAGYAFSMASGNYEKISETHFCEARKANAKVLVELTPLHNGVC